MHLVQVNEKTIWDLEGGRHYVYTAANEVRRHSYVTLYRSAGTEDEYGEKSHWMVFEDKATEEEIARANQQALSFWNYLKSQVKYSAVGGATPYQFTDNGIPGILVDLKD